MTMFESAALTMAAAIASAAFAGAAAFAAWRSAGSEKRLLRRQLTVAANEVDVEASRIEARAGQLKLAYLQLFTFANALDNSRKTIYLDEVDKRVSEAREVAGQAASAANSATRKRISTREADVAGYLTKCALYVSIWKASTSQSMLSACYTGSQVLVVWAASRAAFSYTRTEQGFEWRRQGAPR